MNLYNRDYMTLTQEELGQKKSIEEKNTTRIGNLEVKNTNMNFEFPKAVRHNNSLFPNNYMDFMDLYNFKIMSELNKKYLNAIIDENATELSIKKVIQENKLYHIIGSILKGCQYGFGHHDLFIFPEVQLGSTYRADYLLVGLASGGHQFVFVEMEHPNKDIILNDGNYGSAIRKGLNQINDWKLWLESNFNTLYEVFEKSSYKNLPKEFYKYDSSRMHFVVVAGRRKDFNDKTYRLKRNELQTSGIRILHYDNLYDYSNQIIMPQKYGYLSY